MMMSQKLGNSKGLGLCKHTQTQHVLALSGYTALSDFVATMGVRTQRMRTLHCACHGTTRYHPPA